MFLFWICGALALFGLAMHAVQIVAVRKKLGGERERPDGGALPPVSLLKPLKGLDDNLFDNLESFCLLEYPEYEIIFSLQNANDPACKVAAKVRDKYPERDITIHIEKCDAGLNPKVNNLIPAYKIAKHGLVLISDSNVMVGRQYLREIVRHMDDPCVGLVSNLIRGTGGRSLGSLFEILHLNSFVAGSVCFLDTFLKIPCVIGKSMLMRKKDLEAIGGLESMKDILAEDYMIGERMHRSGKKVVLSRYRIRNVNLYWGMGRFLNRHTRWGKLRWHIGGYRYLLELAGNPVFISWLPVWFGGPSAAALSLALSVSLMKAAGDLYLGKILAGSEQEGDEGETAFSPFFYLLSPVKDLVIGCIWCVPLLSRTVTWRGTTYRIGRDSLLSPCPSEGKGIGKYRYRVRDLTQRVSWGVFRFLHSIRERFA